MEITRKIRRLALLTFVLYLLLLGWIIALKCNMQNAILDAKIFNRSFTLAQRAEMQLGHFSKAEFNDVVVNILFFIPLGALMPLLGKRHAVAKTVLLCFLISTGFEVLQLLNCIGRFTYIDIINNTVGGAIGAVIYWLLHKRAKERRLQFTFAVLIAVLVPTLIAAAINTATHIEYYL